jgi:hypothetical protein
MSQNAETAALLAKRAPAGERGGCDAAAAAFPLLVDGAGAVVIRAHPLFCIYLENHYE